MGLLDGPLRGVAKTLLQTFGTAVTFTRVTPGTYSITAGSKAETTATTSTYGRLDNYRAFELSDNVRVTDQKLTIPAIDLSFTPNQDDRVTIGSDEYEVVDVGREIATDQAAIFVCQIRA